MNAAWHKAHRMPERATLDDRVRWHVAHAKACDCREMPASIAAEIARRAKTPAGRPRGRKAT
jgi:hypothetical protein